MMASLFIEHLACEANFHKKKKKGLSSVYKNKNLYIIKKYNSLYHKQPLQNIISKISG